MQQIEFFSDGKRDKIRIRLDQFSWFSGYVKPEHIHKYPDEWEFYQQKQAEIPPLHGTPLSDLPGYNQQYRSHYYLKGIRTIEELANLSEYAAERIAPDSKLLHAVATMWLKNQQLQEKVVAEHYQEPGDAPKQKRKRKPMTEEQRAAMAERLAKARAARKAKADAGSEDDSQRSDPEDRPG